MQQVVEMPDDKVLHLVCIQFLYSDELHQRPLEFHFDIFVKALCGEITKNFSASRGSLSLKKQKPSMPCQWHKPCCTEITRRQYQPLVCCEKYIRAKKANPSAQEKDLPKISMAVFVRTDNTKRFSSHIPASGEKSQLYVLRMDRLQFV